MDLEPGGLQSMGCKELDTTEQLTLSFSLTHTHRSMEDDYFMYSFLDNRFDNNNLVKFWPDWISIASFSSLIEGKLILWLKMITSRYYYWEKIEGGRRRE